MRFLIFISLAFNIFLASCAQKTTNIENLTIENTFPNQEKFQAKLDEYVELNIIDLGKEQLLNPSYGLNTKEKAENFAKNLVSMKYPENSKSINKNFKISEDRTGKFWFITIGLFPPGQALDGQISLIIIKNNCKVLYYSNHM